MNIKVNFSENSSSFKATMSETSVIDPSDNLAKVAKTGDYKDLINTPSKVSEFKNDAGYAKKTELPTKVSEFENDAEYLKNREGIIYDSATFYSQGVINWENQPAKYVYHPKEITNGKSCVLIPLPRYSMLSTSEQLESNCVRGKGYMTIKYRDAQGAEIVYENVIVDIWDIGVDNQSLALYELDFIRFRTDTVQHSELTQSKIEAIFGVDTTATAASVCSKTVEDVNVAIRFDQCVEKEFYFEKTAHGVEPTSDTHLATKKYVDGKIPKLGTMASESKYDYLPFNYGGTKGISWTINGAIKIAAASLVLEGISSLGGKIKLKDLVDPTKDTDAANKGYVDKLVGDVESALDELHTYAQALAGGGAE